MGGESAPPSERQTESSRPAESGAAAAAPSAATPGSSVRQSSSRASGSPSKRVSTPQKDHRSSAVIEEEGEEEVASGRVTAIGKDRLLTFNFQQATAAATSSGAPNADALSVEERTRYIGNVLRFVPVEVAMRYYQGPLVDTNDDTSFGRRAYDRLKHENVSLGSQAYEHPFNACVLFSDISGFTKLTNRLLKERGDEGAEILNNIICRFFEELISIITRHAGDVIKFAGDAVLSIWSSSVSGEDIDTLTLRAVACALEQVEKLHNWDTGEGVKLQLHLGLGTGPVRGVDLGNHMRREYVVAGEPLKQLSDAEQQASSGQLVVSPAAWKLVSGQCSGSALPDDGFGPGFYVITKCNSKPKLPPHWRVVLEEQMCKETPVPHAALNSFYLYAPGPMRNHMVSGKMRTAASQFREVTMMFIRIGGLKHSDADFLERFQRVVFMICSAVYVFKGSLSRVSIDDKGTCVKVTFGLPPLFHPDDAARAVKCGLLVRDQIRPMRLKANVGITTGTVFIGYVGSNSRGEYTEYGVMVNMAARFMSKATNEVLVNQTTRDKSLQTDKIDYDELEPKPMKGMDEPVKMFRAVARIDANYFEAPLIVKASANDDGRKSHTATDHTASRGSMSTSASSVGMVGRAELVHAIELALHNFGNTGDGFVMLLRGAPGVASACANAFGQSTDRSNASSQQWSQAGASHAVVEVAAPTQAQSDAAHAQVAKFKQHESLLNAVLNDSTFAESDATLALSEDAKSELTMHMLTHILANALEADLSSGSAGAVIIIEDAQWMDSASWTLLNRLVEQIDSVSVVITMAELPGIGGGIGNLGATQIGSAAAAAVSGSGVAHQSDMSKEAAEFLKVPRLVNHEVRPLDRSEVHELICAIFRVNHVQPEVVDSVCDRISGNALWCIELAQTMLHRGVLKVYNGACNLAIALEEIDTIGLPNSLQAHMAMQLEEVSTDCAACLKAASVMGLQFPAVVLSALSDDVFGSEETKEEKREALLKEALAAKLLEKVSTSNPWGKFLDNERRSGDGERSGGVYRFSTWMLQEVAYNALPFEERRQKHLAIAKWIERTLSIVLEDKAPDTHLRLWLYPMLADHWMQMTGEAAATAVSYWEGAARAALQQNQNHEAIGFGTKELRLLKERDLRGDGDKDNAIHIALVQEMLAEAYLADGKVHEAKEVILEALEVLDIAPTLSKEALRKRFRYEFKWLKRPALVKGIRSLYWRRELSSTGKWQADQVELTAAKLYEHLGRTAYLFEEMELHDFAVLRCLNLSTLLKRGTNVTLIAHANFKKRPSPAIEQLARAYAAATIVDRVSHDHRMRSRYAEYSRQLERAVSPRSDSLTLYINIMFGLSAMREPDWKRAGECLALASKAAERLNTGRRYEEAMHSLGLSQFFQGELQGMCDTYERARDVCLSRRDKLMIAKLTAGVCVPLLAFGRHNEAFEMLEPLISSLEEAREAQTSNFANCCGLLAMSHLRMGQKEMARDRAETALAVFKSAGNSALATFYGFAAAVEVLLRLLAVSESPLDYEAAKQALKGSGARDLTRAVRAGRDRAASNGEAKATLAEATPAATPAAAAPAAGESPMDKFRRASIKAGKMSLALSAVDESVTATATTEAIRAGVAPPLSRRKSLFARNTTRAALALKVDPGLDRDNLTLSVLVEALEHLERFATRHPAALPRQHLYAGWLQLILKHRPEAAVLMHSGVLEAKRLHMPYESALLMRELGRMNADRGLLEEAYLLLEPMHARAEAGYARNELQKLPGGYDHRELQRRAKSQSTAAARGSIVPYGLLGMVVGGVSDSVRRAGSVVGGGAGAMETTPRDDPAKRLDMRKLHTQSERQESRVDSDRRDKKLQPAIGGSDRNLLAGRSAKSLAPAGLEVVALPKTTPVDLTSIEAQLSAGMARAPKQEPPASSTRDRPPSFDASGMLGQVLEAVGLAPATAPAPADREERASTASQASLQA